MNLEHPKVVPDLGKLGALHDRATIAAAIDEPLRRSAPINYTAAESLCPSTAGAYDCQAYHGLWQYLRLADFVRALQIDGPLFVDAASRFAEAGGLQHVLISATADYSMLAHLAHGAAKAHRPVTFDIVDLCATTLAINEWYANERGLKIRVFKSDVHAFEPDSSYDLICTHSFLPWHTIEQRPALFRRWRDWLRPGGRLCFSNRVSPHSVPFDPAERADRVERMIGTTLTGLRERAVPLPCPEAEFVVMLRKFGDRRRETYPELPLATLKQWIADAGLNLELAVTIAEVLPGVQDTTVISGTEEGRPRMWFQAHRP